jgi:hypothetical protein
MKAMRKIFTASHIRSGIASSAVGCRNLHVPDLYFRQRLVLLGQGLT